MLLQSMEVRRIPWGDWTVSVNHLLDMCTQCHIERGRNDTPLSHNMSELIAQTMNEVGVATEGIAGCLPPVTSATFRWQTHVQQPVAVGIGAPQRMAVGGAVLDVVEVDNMETVRRLVRISRAPRGRLCLRDTSGRVVKTGTDEEELLQYVLDHIPAWRTVLRLKTA